MPFFLILIQWDKAAPEVTNQLLEFSINLFINLLFRDLLQHTIYPNNGQLFLKNFVCIACSAAI